MEQLYFDHNATTPLCAEAKRAWAEAVDAHWMNPSSPYRAAAAVHARLEAAREEIAGFFEIEPKRIVFTSGATEANNAVFQYWADVLPGTAKVGLSPVEHPSVLEAAERFLGERSGHLSVDADGRVDLVALEARLAAGELAAVSVMAANNETGVVQPWRDIARLCREVGVPYHCDASQWVGKMPLSGLGDCSFVSVCAHKFAGPKGVGFLILPDTESRCRVMLGGEQEHGHRAGTENVPGVLAMLAALRAARPQTAAARDAFIARITKAIPGTTVVGVGTERLWNTVSLIMPEFSSTRWVRALEKAGCLLSSGSACSTGQASVSHVLLAMGIDPAAAGRVLRISSGFATSAKDWEALSEAFLTAQASLRKSVADSPSKVISID
ncbi:MAG: aminotransferase class V-fold PLP-dependent enzyme [Verrucomicrobia bacterium]|jgi:cysteine desulfurase|nr:aminotransferase class V-fold PLP-dependent enzyme [Verrucomicrobiota bacterium]